MQTNETQFLDHDDDFRRDLRRIGRHIGNGNQDGQKRIDLLVKLEMGETAFAYHMVEVMVKAMTPNSTIEEVRQLIEQRIVVPAVQTAFDSREAA